MTQRQRLIARANKLFRTRADASSVRLHILASEKITEHGPEVVHGPGDVR